VNLQSNDFELFAVAQQFAQDRAALDARWKELQREAHPDKFAAHGAPAQRVAMQWSVRINEAYQRLKSPLKRGAYLCELGGASVNSHTNTAMPSAFLMQQMEWREAMDEAREMPALQQLQKSVQSTEQRLLEQLEDLLDRQRDCVAAAGTVRSLMFIEKFGHDLSRAMAAMEDALDGQ